MNITKILEKTSKKVIPKSVFPEFRELAKAVYGLSTVKPMPSDVFLVSYPRSGNTWVRLIIANILFPQRDIKSLRELELLVPGLHRYTKYNYRSVSNKLVIKSHFSRPCNPNTGTHNPVIYVVRNPVDVAKSYFDYKLKNNDLTRDLSIEAFVDMLVNGAIFPCSWSEHVSSWVGAPYSGKLLLVKYEDLLEDTTSEIRNIASFLDHDLSIEEAEIIKRATTRERMIALEKRAPLGDTDHDHVRRQPEQRDVDFTMTNTLAAKILEHSRDGLNAADYDHLHS